MPAHREVFWHDGPAAMTGLRGVVRGYFDHCAASLFRFAGTEVDKVAPSCIKNRFVQTRFGSGSIGQILASFGVLFWLGGRGQIGDLEVFKNDHLIAIDQFARFLMVKVSATMAHLTIEPR